MTAQLRRLYQGTCRLRLLSLKVIELAISNCFVQLIQQNLKSITLPSIGAGQLGYPADLVANTMTQAITGHFLNNLNDGLEVVVCVYEKDLKTAQVFSTNSILLSCSCFWRILLSFLLYLFL